jgi:signal transduction histidine kinase
MQKAKKQIEEVLDQTLEIIVHQQRFFGVNLVKEYGESVPPVTVDSSLMEQVFMNIILNGVDAMKGAGTLTLRTRVVDNWVEIDIEDTGVGMPEKILDKIFDPFFTTKDSTEGLGMGLGLAVTYGIIQNHNGDIVVKSKEGVGTTFTIRLPVEPK